jgi:TonB family protein
VQDVQQTNQQRESTGESRENRENPIVVFAPRPFYPSEARKKKIEGEVMLEATIGTDGIPREIKVTSSLDPLLDENAIQAISTWRFEPATKDGKPIEKRVPISVRYSIVQGEEDAIHEEVQREKLNAEARESAGQALVTKDEVELTRQRMNEMQAKRKMHDQNLNVLRQQLEELEKEREKAAVSRDVESLKRVEDQLALLQSAIDKQDRETHAREEVGAEQPEKLKIREEEMNGWAINRADEKQKEKLVSENDAALRADLAKRAKISMAKAIEVATKEQPGTVVNCELRGGGDNSDIFYAITIVPSDERQGKQTHILVSAIDGKLFARRGK